jgi:hypothetical protein
MCSAAGGVQDQDVDQVADFVDAQPDRVRLDVIIGSVVGGDDREGTSCAIGGARLDPGPVHHLDRKVTMALFRALCRRQTN